jgi:NADH:ubiquinone oxidoreductase subunit 6 (subunit J)
MKNRVYNLLGLVSIFFVASIGMMVIGLELLGLLTIFIYVGAISILFLFVIMFIEIRYLESKYSSWRSIFGKSFFLILILLIIFEGAANLNLLFRVEVSKISYDFNTDSNIIVSTITRQIGAVMYTEYSLGVLICGLILLVAMVCAIVISSLL